MKCIQYFCVFVAAACLAACSFTTPEYKSTLGNSEMSLTAVQPTSAVPGTILAIYGTNFNDSTLKVYFNDVPADSVFNISPTALRAIMPAMEPGEKVNVTVTSADRKMYSNGMPLITMEAPQKVRTVYWTTHDLYRGSVAGSKMKTEFLFEDDFPRGLVVDTVRNELFWGNGYGRVFRSTLTAPERQPVLDLGSGLSDMTMDAAREWVYYVKDNERIMRTSLKDTSKHEVLFSARQVPYSLRISAAGDKLFWCEFDGLRVLRGDAKGGEPVVLLDGDDGLAGPRAIEIDEKNGMLYIADTPAPGNSNIFSCRLNGEDVTKLWHSNDGIGEVVVDVAVDAENGYLYWINAKGHTKQDLDDGEIMRSRLDGKGKPEIVFQPINYGHQLSF